MIETCKGFSASLESVRHLIGGSWGSQWGSFLKLRLIWNGCAVLLIRFFFSKTDIESYLFQMDRPLNHVGQSSQNRLKSGFRFKVNCQDMWIYYIYTYIHIYIYIIYTPWDVICAAGLGEQSLQTGEVASILNVKWVKCQYCRVFHINFVHQH